MTVKLVCAPGASRHPSPEFQGLKSFSIMLKENRGFFEGDANLSIDFDDKAAEDIAKHLKCNVADLSVRLRNRIIVIEII